MAIYKLNEQIEIFLIFSPPSQQHLRSEKEDTLIASIKGLSGSWLGGKLDNTPTRGAPTIVYNDNGPFHHSKLREGFFQELVGNKWREILHRQSCRMCGKPHT